MDDPLSPLAPGTPALDFTLPRASYVVISLTDVRGRPAILMIDPTEWKPVSLQHLVLCQDHLEACERLGAVLLAISTDHVWSHAAFARTAGIRYPLLADAHSKGVVCRAHGVYDDQAGSSARARFILDQDGIIRWSHTSPAAINPGMGGILRALESMAFTRSIDRSGPVARKGESHAHCSRSPR